MQEWRGCSSQRRVLHVKEEEGTMVRVAEQRHLLPKSFTNVQFLEADARFRPNGMYTGGTASWWIKLAA